MQSTSIIISTYNKPHFLKKVLTGYTCQTYKNFDIIIADDGSRKDTKNIIGYFKDNTSLDIKHIWHEDKGFQKSVILNKAIQASKSDYLIFSDGDCIPNQSFVQTHIDLAEKNYFLSGGHFPLSSSASNLITEDIILSQKCFNKGFLISSSQILSKNYLKLLQTNLLSKFLDLITPTKSTFNGNNSSAWRKDIIKVDGFDERMQYGGLDCELGERINNMGVQSKQIRNRSACLHLYHNRPYKNNISTKKNRLIRHETYINKSIHTSFGIKNKAIKKIPNKNLSIIFDVSQFYYLPQYLPVYHEFLKRKKGSAMFVFYHGKFDTIIKNIIKSENLSHIWVENKTQASKYYQNKKADWIFFGNTYPFLDKIHQVSKSIQLGHGIGPKSSYYRQSDTPTTVRFVEGKYRKNRLENMHPDNNFVDVGFCKLDPILNGDITGYDLRDLNLEPEKKTIVYAPTFYPSSIERFPKNFPKDLQEFNIIIKPHYFSLIKENYTKQRKLFDHWSKYNNVYLSKFNDYSLLPFMVTADLMISDTSSAILEFSALNKPVFICKFLKLRWNYRGVFSYRLKKRMDTDYNFYSKFSFFSQSYFDLISSIKNLDLDTFSYKKSQKDFIENMIGSLDGNSSKRIVDYIEIN